MSRALLLLPAAVLCGCFADKPLPPECEGSPCIRQLRPGQARVVSGANAVYSDVHLTAAGSVLVVSHGPEGVGEIWVSRSPDNGRSWRTTNLGNGDPDLCPKGASNPEGRNHLLGGRAFAISEGLVGVSGTQHTCEPRDAFLSYSDDDGLSYSPGWINISLSGDLSDPKEAPLVIGSGEGERFAALFFAQQPRFRSSADIDDWSGSKRRTLEEEKRRVHFALARSKKDDIYALLFDAQQIKLYRSGDGGQSFDRLSDPHAVPYPLKRGDLWIDPESGYFYACGVARPADARVYTLHSTSGGKDWSEPTLYLEGLQPATSEEVTCDVGPAGVTVGYRDGFSGAMKVILPQAPPPETLGCSDGSVPEQSYGMNIVDGEGNLVPSRVQMVRCAVAGRYDQGICAFGWHICNHTEFLSALANDKPTARYWLNAYVQTKHNPPVQTVVDNPDPGCFDYQGSPNEESVQAVTDVDKDPSRLPYVDAAVGMNAATACEEARADGAMCCRGL